MLTTGALARGLVGLVIDGGVRDVEALERFGFLVFATGVVLQGGALRSGRTTVELLGLDTTSIDRGSTR